jgi:hypothetical protein
VSAYHHIINAGHLTASKTRLDFLDLANNMIVTEGFHHQVAEDDCMPRISSVAITVLFTL